MRFYLLFILVLFYSFDAASQEDFYNLAERGVSELAEGESIAARSTMQKALEKMPENIDPEFKANFLSNLGVAYYQTGEYRKGIKAYTGALEIYLLLKNDSLKAGGLLNLGLAYKDIGASARAVEILTQAARISERYGNNKELASAWNAIGNIKRESGDYEKALYYHFRALATRKSIGYEKGVADSYNNIGVVYLELKRYEAAEKYLSEALRRKNVLANQSNMVNTLYSLGKLYLEKNDNAAALHFSELAYAMYKKNGNSPGTSTSLYSLAAYYETVGNKTKSLDLLNAVILESRSSYNYPLLADAIAKEIEILTGTSASDVLIEKYRELLKVRELSAADANSKEIARLEVEYDVERKEREISIREKQSKLDRIRIENETLQNQQLFTGVIGISILALVLLFMFYQIRRRKRYI